MGKRSEFERKPLDFYETPLAAVGPLLHCLPVGIRFCEPCAGAGALVGHLERSGHTCVAAYDVVPRADGIGVGDASFLQRGDCGGAEFIITNPPWNRQALHQIIERCAALLPTWLLFDADWMHTKQAKLHLEICHKIISIGRVKWFGNTSGMDNCCWYLFDVQKKYEGTIFVGR